ncbi:hypothetical protein [Brevibacillus agri]|uniref:hypothetical protein n=1 Tax=Brevibacillus agri TaxID=51101 RepID=UPI001EE57D3A|nr:hypothetical protein [Brevibacillus agri]MCG5252618.1 hypothetical protein [Brevibacillus agri]
MAKYKSTPFYEIEGNGVRVKFDFFGEYETNKADEIAALNALCPTWVVCIDPTGAIEPKPEEPAKPARKSSAK